MKFLYLIIFLFFLGIITISCESEINYTPKPRCYPKVEYPEKSYQSFTKDYCNFSFEYPKYALIEKDEKYFDGKTLNECWFDVVVPELNGRIHCSYYPIDEKNSYEKLMTDAFKLAQEHNPRADYIDKFPFQKENGVSGFIFEIGGPAASPFQFFVTDSTHHFMRGSLYIKAQAVPDSLQPIIDFLKVDATHLLNTFEWE